MTEFDRDGEETASQAGDARRDLTTGVANLLRPHAPPASLHQRLMASVSKVPMRYAPFYGRVAELFEISEANAEAELARLADPKCWSWTGLPGVSATHVKTPHLKVAEARLVRFAPGTHFPHHGHSGEERVLVLEGSYVDDAGVEHGPGDLNRMPAGSQHGFVVSRDGPCIAAARLDDPLVFSAWPLRLLAKLMRR